VLSHDCEDADFAFFEEDRGRFLEAVPDLVRAGFEPLYRFVANDGEPVEHSFARDGAKFEFFEHQRLGATIRCRFFGTASTERGAARTEYLSEVPAFGLGPMDFLGCRWLKPTTTTRS